MSNQDDSQAATDTQTGPNVYTGWGADRLAFADAAEKLLREIFAALGARNAHALDVADVLSGLGAWLALLMTMTRFREGDAAVIWLDARRIAWERGQALSPDAARREANAQADAAVHDFYQRFPPSLDTRDEEIEALQEEAHGLRAVADAAEKRAETLQSNLLAELGAHPESDLVVVAGDWKWRAEKAERELADLRTAAGHMANTPTLLVKPKPERVEPGQRWAFVMKADDNEETKADYAFLFRDAYGEPWQAGPADIAAAYYLGPAPTVEN